LNPRNTRTAPVNIAMYAVCIAESLLGSSHFISFKEFKTATALLVPYEPITNEITEKLIGSNIDTILAIIIVIGNGTNDTINAITPTEPIVIAIALNATIQPYIKVVNFLVTLSEPHKSVRFKRTSKCTNRRTPPMTRFLI
jgi:hypothetical protein